MPEESKFAVVGHRLDPIQRGPLRLTSSDFSLSKRRRAILQQLWENREEESGELVCSIPGGWWLGDDQISGNLCLWALRHDLIRVQYTSEGNGIPGKYTIYVPTEEVGRVLSELGYVPDGNRAGSPMGGATDPRWRRFARWSRSGIPRQAAKSRAVMAR